MDLTPRFRGWRQRLKHTLDKAGPIQTGVAKRRCGPLHGRLQSWIERIERRIACRFLKDLRLSLKT